MLIRFKGSDKLWNTDFFLDVNVDGNSLIICDSYLDEHKITYENYGFAVSALNNLLTAVGGAVIEPTGKLDESDSWKNSDVYRDGKKVNPKKEDDKDDNPF